MLHCGFSTFHELADEFETIEVETDAIVSLEIDENRSSLTICRIDEDGTITDTEHKDAQITMPDKAGYYIYELKVLWAKGKSTFVFDVFVK